MPQTWKVDNLNVTVFENRNLLGDAAAQMAKTYITDAIEQCGRAVVAFSTGTSQLQFYKALVKQPIDWSKVEAFHLDAYIGLQEEHPGSFRRYLHERLLDYVTIAKFHMIKGDADDVYSECHRLDLLARRRPLDVVFASIGENGQLAFNESPAIFDEDTYYKIVELSDASRRQQFGEGWFLHPDDVPRQAITITISAIIKARTVICCVPDLRKAQAVYNTLTQPFSHSFPATVLRFHTNAHLLLDPHSAAQIL
ncbi:6-phosphogluconolactonase [candidate division KSB1 bacterium]|nr:6-phosphogluconolactonase [candidate division KSB1 bacterium]